ncbi:MAG: Crp/Fnr family transcriptional regulator, partial [Acidimicrobiales bacterium]
SEKLAETTKQLMEVLFEPADKRVLRALLRLAAVFGPGGGPTTIVIRQEDLAAMVGSRRQTVSRPLKRAAHAGAIRLGRGRIHVDDRALLTRLAR